MLTLPMAVVIHIGGSIVSIRPYANCKFTDSKRINDGGGDEDNAFL